jgi:hypothetical protein
MDREALPRMKHSVEELLEIVYRYYPRGVRLSEPAYPRTEEYGRRVEARREAINDYQRFLALLGRLRARFTEGSVEDLALYHPRGDFTASFSARLVLPTLPPHVGQHALYFMRSFLAPYYIIVSATSLYVKKKGGGYKITEEERHTLTAEEEPYATIIAAEIEATFGGERMPTDVGEVLVPDVDTQRRSIGESTLFDCFFTAYRS